MLTGCVRARTRVCKSKNNSVRVSVASYGGCLWVMWRTGYNRKSLDKWGHCHKHFSYTLTHAHTRLAVWKLKFLRAQPHGLSDGDVRILHLHPSCVYSQGRNDTTLGPRCWSQMLPRLTGIDRFLKNLCCANQLFIRPKKKTPNHPSEEGGERNLSISWRLLTESVSHTDAKFHPQGEKRSPESPTRSETGTISSLVLRQCYVHRRRY